MKSLRMLGALLTALSILLSFCACNGAYKPPVNKGDEGEGGLAEQPPLDNDPTNDFTVELRLNGEAYKPAIAINVYFSDGYDIFVAPIGEDGVARIDGLDGDYHVTLSVVPSGCAYDANSYTVTNYNRSIVIDLYNLDSVSGRGSELYSCYNISTTGLYSVTITEPGELAYFEFAPQYNGVYTVESWASVTEDEINPIAIAYYGSSVYKHSPYTVEDLGAVGSFTRNFIHTVKIADQMISGAGSQTFTFAVTAESKSGIYPVTFTFAIKRDGGFDIDGAEKKMVPVGADFSAFDFEAFEQLAGGKIVGAETLFKDANGNDVAGAYVFEAEGNYKLYPISEGGDGMYHVYNEVKYADNNGYGPLLVAYISEPCRFLDKAFTTIESAGNNALTVNGTENYKQFIEGYEALASGGFYCVSDCPCHKDSTSSLKACPEGCTSCKSVCTQCPPDMIGKEGYAALCNSDGVAPVTEELADFLQKFAITQRYFADGDGWAERNGVYAYEDSQWLFACGYYQ